jgi:hypothetical protein
MLEGSSGGRTQALPRSIRLVQYQQSILRNKGM